MSNEPFSVTDSSYATAYSYSSLDLVTTINTDPMSLVPYVYCVDNPLRWVDPLGLQVETAQINFVKGVLEKIEPSPKGEWF